MCQYELGDKLMVVKAPSSRSSRVGTIVEVVEDLGSVWISDTEVELDYIEGGEQCGYEFVKMQYLQPVATVPVVGNPKYNREIKPGTFVDVYDVLYAFKVTDPCLQHLIKKALAAGQRGHKDARQDLVDIRDSAQRALDSYDIWEVAA